MSLAKSIGKLVGRLRATPHVIGLLVGIPLLGQDRAWTGATERIAKIPGFIGVYTRQAFYKSTLRHVGQDVYFGFMSVISKQSSSVGDRAYIGRFCSLGLVEIGDDVMLADHVQVLSGGHTHGSEAKPGQTLHDNALQFTKVTISQGAWIGAGAIVMADVGEGAIIGAGAVATKPVAAHSKAVGVPAKPI
ncbi:MAG: hypothetical protein GC164_05935 [Phycisphaera sp.]|nr:hypothetical protein [Phycisphaera sp.]